MVEPTRTEGVQGAILPGGPSRSADPSAMHRGSRSRAPASSAQFRISGYCSPSKADVKAPAPGKWWGRGQHPGPGREGHGPRRAELSTSFRDRLPPLFGDLDPKDHLFLDNRRRGVSVARWRIHQSPARTAARTRSHGPRGSPLRTRLGGVRAPRELAAVGRSASPLHQTLINPGDDPRPERPS
jgi:hypothetical protein